MMPKNTERALIESDAFGNLVPEIDKKAANEKGPGSPAYWEMIFWWTRKPTTFVETIYFFSPHIIS